MLIVVYLRPHNLTVIQYFNRFNIATILLHQLYFADNLASSAYDPPSLLDRYNLLHLANR